MIPKKDLKIHYTRGNGPGGQHKNKVETCCEITHVPTGIKERCQDSRSKTTNYETALARVTKRVLKLFVDSKKASINVLRREALEKVIRTYNFQRHEVKDHRNGRIAPIDKVLNGHIELLQ